MTHAENCPAMRHALEEGYLHQPMGLVQENGSLTMKPLPPAIMGPLLTERGKKRKPWLIVSFCPWCGSELEPQP